MQRPIRSPQIAPIRRPAAVEPVKLTLSTASLTTIALATSRSAGSRFSTPAGNPAAAAASAMMNASIGVSGAGFMMTVLPASSAGITLFSMIVNGAFHGAIAATVPSGSRTISAVPWPSVGRSSRTQSKRST